MSIQRNITYANQDLICKINEEMSYLPYCKCWGFHIGGTGSEYLICIINADASYFPYGNWQGCHIVHTVSYRKGEYNDMCVMLMRALFA